MKRIVSTLALVMATAALPALAQTNKPDVTAPSGQSSGTGIQGHPGSKSGPPAKAGTTGSGSADQSKGETVQQQDPSKVKGLPGSKSGPPAKQPSR